jgi:hypothetical protein
MHDPGIGCPPPSPPASLLLPLELPELLPLELPELLPELPPLELPELLLVPPSGTHACAAFWVHVVRSDWLHEAQSIVCDPIV